MQGQMLSVVWKSSSMRYHDEEQYIELERIISKTIKISKEF